MAVTQKRPGVWVCDFKLFGQRFRPTVYADTKLEAQHKEADEKAAKEKELLQHSARGMLISEAIDRLYADSWEENKTGEDSLKHLYFFLEVCGDIEISAVTEKHITAYVSKVKQRRNGKPPKRGQKDERKKIAYTTVNRWKASVKTLLRTAMVEWREMDSIPYIKLQKETNHQVRWLTYDEEGKLMDALLKRLTKPGSDKGKYPLLLDMIPILIDTGLRSGELCQLTEHQVSLDRAEVYLLSKGGCEIKTKSGYGRTVPLTTRALAIFKRVIDETPTGLRLFETNSNYIGQAFRKLRNDMGLQHDKAFTPKVLRHTCASRWVQSGVDLYRVKELLGHHSVTVTESRYAHLATANLHEALEQVNKVAAAELERLRERDAAGGTPVVTSVVN